MELIIKIDKNAKEILSMLHKYPNLSLKELDELRVKMNMCSNFLGCYLYCQRVNGVLIDIK